MDAVYYRNKEHIGGVKIQASSTRGESRSRRIKGVEGEKGNERIVDGFMDERTKEFGEEKGKYEIAAMHE